MEIDKTDIRPADADFVECMYGMLKDVTKTNMTYECMTNIEIQLNDHV